MQEEIRQIQEDLLSIVKYVQEESSINEERTKYICEQIDLNTEQIGRLIKHEELFLGDDLVHVNTGKYINVGDVFLNIAVKKIISIGLNRPVDWVDCSVSEEFNKTVAKASNSNKAIIVGGGGLFFNASEDMPGTWQWNIKPEAIDKLKIPVYIFAVGYNQFRNQGPMRHGFADELNKLAEKCGFIGLRNNGSIQAIKTYLDEKYHNKIRFQPCPTTMISKMYNIEKNSNSDFIAINMSADKWDYRFGSEERRNEVIRQTIIQIMKLSSHYKIKYYSHFGQDEFFAELLKLNNVNFEHVKVDEHATEEEMISLYSAPKLVIGMRGHAQMIPFGCGTPILSIISHDKMKYFLDDIGHPEWGVDVLDADYGEKLYNTAIDIMENEEQIKNEISRIQDVFWDISMKNIEEIKNTID